VGWKLESRLADLVIKSVRDLRAAGRALLQRELGDKSGDALWRSAHGKDERAVETIKARKCAARPPGSRV
jgi:nucleotidyltransferase/DNA polymerase involved in DNA repair